MPLITDPAEATAIFEEVRQAGATVPCYCTENVHTLEAILGAAQQVGSEFGIPAPPIIVGFTGNYPYRPQLVGYTAAGDALEGLFAVRADLERLVRPDGPYGNVRAMAHLDHGDPDTDAAILEEGAGFLSSAMYDCSELPLAENIERTKAFVQRMEGKMLVEGIVDEIYGPEAGTDFDLTRPEDAERYVAETNVPFIVVNVGTEHRSAAGGRAQYNGERAREIAERVGRIMCLHGASSLGGEGLDVLPSDGFIKVNIWTILERTGAQALAVDMLENLGYVLSAEQLRSLVDRGVITAEHAQEQEGREPTLDYFPHANRRDGAWLPAVKELLVHDLRDLGYAKLAAQ
jgi:fructose/tagatose bisphosphate aldolase